jgi:hypothetical protein
MGLLQNNCAEQAIRFVVIYRKICRELAVKMAEPLANGF